MIDLFHGFVQLTIDLDSVDLTAVVSLQGFYSWGHMPQGYAGSLGSFVRILRQVVAGLDSQRKNLDGAIIFDPSSAQCLHTIPTFLSRLHGHDIKVSPSKAILEATQVVFLGHSISFAGVRPGPKKVAALDNIPMPTDVSQLLSLLAGLSYHTKFLTNSAKRLQPVTDLLRQHISYYFTPETERVIRNVL